jgi:predicted ribonuclease YlaK
MAINHLCVVSRGDQVLTYNNTNKKYSIFNCPEGTGASMSALQTIATLLENIPENETNLNIILIPKNLGLLLKKETAYEVRDNNYTTKTGKKLTKEYIDMMCYINDLREWFGTSIVRFKIAGSEALYANEKKIIKDTWNKFDELTKQNIEIKTINAD